MFSGQLIKCHKVTERQPRNFVITKLNIYNFKEKGKAHNEYNKSVTVDSVLELRRAIPIESLAGITKLLNQES